MSDITNPPVKISRLLRKIAAFFMTVAMIALVLMFSLVLFAAILAAAAIVWAYLWWKTRGLRKQMRDFCGSATMRGGEVFDGKKTGGEIIEGEVIRVSTDMDAWLRSK